MTDEHHNKQHQSDQDDQPQRPGQSGETGRKESDQWKKDNPSQREQNEGQKKAS
jgi:hypothetical protein